MRTALLMLAALSMLPSPREADACGSYVQEPRILTLSTHGIPRGKPRTFVVLGTAPDETRAWRQLAPRSYDPTRIALGARRAQPHTFTIIGRDGTKVVTGTQEVFLAQTFQFREATVALELPYRGDFAVAIEGAHAEAKWIEIDTSKTARVGDLALATDYDDHARRYVTVVKRDGREVTRRSGWPLGIVELDGSRRLVFGDGPYTTSLAI